MKITEARLAANRRNAQFSTGPRTDHGKNRSKLNAFRHGLTAQIVVMPEEDLKRYQTFCQGFFTDWMPANTTETRRPHLDDRVIHTSPCKPARRCFQMLISAASVDQAIQAVSEMLGR